MQGLPVKLYVYDLSGGLAASMSRALVGKQIDGIWCVVERFCLGSFRHRFLTSIAGIQVSLLLEVSGTGAVFLNRACLYVNYTQRRPKIDDFEEPALTSELFFVHFQGQSHYGVPVRTVEYATISW